MITLLPDIEKISPAVATFLAHCDDVIYSDEFPTAGTLLLEGKLTLLLGRLYKHVSVQGKVEILEHECGHFLMGHLGRCGERDLEKWNRVCDASIHFTRTCDWELIEREAPGFQAVIFERLKDKDTGAPLSPMPPEIAYERVADPPTMYVSIGTGKDGSSCGSMQHSKSDKSTESLEKRAIAGDGILKADPEFAKKLRGFMGGNEAGSGRTVPDLKPPRQWIKKVLQYLIYTRERADRRRSWRREHRSFPVLPGQTRLQTRGGLFMLDASGSISNEQLGDFLSAVVNTPELKGSEVIIFDTTASEPIPLTDVNAIVSAVKKKGGGTAIKAVGNQYRDHRPCVWITDALTGDGWPKPHTAAEVWCVWGSAPAPPHGITIRIQDDE